MWRQACVLSLCLLPEAVLADVLTFAISPTSNPADGVSCRIEVRDGQVIVVEVVGTGMPPHKPLRWPVRRYEQVAVLRALQAFVSGDLASVDAYTSRLPAEPYVTVTWSTELDNAAVNGLYVQSGLVLPAVLAQAIDATMPGSECQTTTR
ncbi:MAG: hypothetical protein ABI832_01815 [bacterium]